ASFQEETVGDSTLFESVLFNRKRWDRGLGVSRPSDAFLRDRLLPRPGAGATVADYIDDRAKFITGELFDLTAAPAYTNEDVAQAEAHVKDRVPYLERLPSPWRLQFLAQEVLDQYSGRFFHAVLPAPEAVLGPVGALRASWPAFCGTNPDQAI